MAQKAWYIGNTTVRNPTRLKEGLKALSESSLHGNLIKANQTALALLLDTAEIVDLKRSSDADISDMGRKWKAALTQLGFITPDTNDVREVRYEPHTVTPNGYRLIEADTLAKEQECFLRALLAHQIPSDIEAFPDGPIFSPLRITLEVLDFLRKSDLDPYISRNEMASIVMLLRSSDEIANAIAEINKYRVTESSFQNRRDRLRFAKEYRERVATTLPTQNADTILTYADCNFRYLKLTGLFSERGMKLGLLDYKWTTVQQILNTPFVPTVPSDYPNRLWNGSILPTDNAANAIVAIESLIRLLEENGESLNVPNLYMMDIQDLSQYRLSLEDIWFKVLEMRFAQRQSSEWENILEYFRELSTSAGRRGGLIPQGEAPAYFEWTLWRAFLAINSLVNPPWECRRFKIDADFEPIGPAPGGGPDLLFEFDEFVVVVEATLSTSSRQEAMEGEPVRRHVAQYVDYYAERGKSVYGLFLANRIDTNTAETFRIGVWYRPDDTKMALKIVPITITQFIELFDAGFRNQSLNHRVIEQMIRECLVESNSDAPQWKQSITLQINRIIQTIQHTS